MSKSKNVAPINILDKRMEDHVLRYRVLWEDKSKSWVEAEQLKKYRELVKDFEDNAKEVEYEVEVIEKHRHKGDIIQYFIKWKGFNRRFNTWENETNMYSQEVVDAYWAKHPEASSIQDSSTTSTSKRKRPYSDRRKVSLRQIVSKKKITEKPAPLVVPDNSTPNYDAICSRIIRSNTVAILEVPQLVLVLGLKNETIDSARNKVMVATAQNSITLDAIQRCDVEDNAWLIKVPGPDVLILHKRELEASFGKIFCYALDITAARKVAKKQRPQLQKTRKRKRGDSDEEYSEDESYIPTKRATKKGARKRGRPRKIVHKPLRRGSYQYGVSRIIGRQMVSAGKWEYRMELEPLDDDFREAVAVMSSDVYISGSGNQEGDIHSIESCKIEGSETYYKVLWKGRRELLLPESIMRLMYPITLQNYCETQAQLQRAHGRTMGGSSSGYLTSRSAVYIRNREVSNNLDDDASMLVRAQRLSRLKTAGEGLHLLARATACAAAAAPSPSQSPATSPSASSTTAVVMPETAGDSSTVEPIVATVLERNTNGPIAEPTKQNGPMPETSKKRS